MAPCCLPSINCYNPIRSPASNWQRGAYKEICDGCPPMQPQCRFPPIQPYNCCAPTGGVQAYAPMAREDCTLPPVGCGSQVNFCGNHPRDDCCRIPQNRCLPTLPCCTPAPVCVERVKNMKPDTIYEPPSVPFDGCSRYRTDYRGPCGAPAMSCKPNTTIDQSSGRMDGMSVYRDAYTWKQIGPIERVKKSQDYEPSTAPFEGCSRYRIDFRGCYGSPAQSVKPATTVDQSSGKMEGCSSYRHEFIPYCASEYQYARGSAVKPLDTDHMSCAPFEGCSTYRLDFQPKCTQKTPSMKPTNSAAFSSGAIANCTTYRNDYGPFYFGICDPCCVPSRC